MAEQTLTSLTINSLLIGLLVMGLISSYVLLVNNEGRGEIFDDYPEVESYNLQVSELYNDGNLLETANINSNISADYNSEISQSGADKSGNAIAINLQDLTKITWASISFLGIILFGNIYAATLSVLVVSVIGLISVAYILKAIRTGQT